MRSLIIGYGNTLRGDDGVGPVVAEWVGRIVDAGRTRVLVRHQLTPELAEDVAAADRVIFVDAAADEPAGAVRVVELLDAAAGLGENSHAVNPAWLLRTARELYGRSPRAWAVIVGGADFSLAEALSPAARRGARQAVGRVLELLEEPTDARDVDRHRPRRARRSARA